MLPPLLVYYINNALNFNMKVAENRFLLRKNDILRMQISKGNYNMNTDQLKQTYPVLVR